MIEPYRVVEEINPADSVLVSWIHLSYETARFFTLSQNFLRQKNIARRVIPFLVERDSFLVSDAPIPLDFLDVHENLRCGKVSHLCYDGGRS